MADKIIKSRIQVKRGTSSDWQAAEATFRPLEGEIIFYTDLNKIRIGKKENSTDEQTLLLKDLTFIRVSKSDIDDFEHTHEGLYYDKSTIDSLIAGLEAKLEEKANLNHQHLLADISNLFVGTKTKYEEVADTVPVGAIVILVEDDETASAISAKLGVAVLGQMKLGQD